MTAPQYYAGMRRHFGLKKAGAFMDTLLLQVGREPKIDLLSFDDWLHTEHGEYESEGLSMAQCIATHYGEDAAAFIKSLI